MRRSLLHGIRKYLWIVCVFDVKGSVNLMSVLLIITNPSNDSSSAEQVSCTSIEDKCRNSMAKDEFSLNRQMKDPRVKR